MSARLAQLALAAMNKVTKWRVLLTGWQLGTRPKGDPEADAVRDLRELCICLRVELNTVNALLLKHGIVTPEQYHSELIDEAQKYDQGFERRFPGFRAIDNGIEIFDVQKAMETQKGWKP